MADLHVQSIGAHRRARGVTMIEALVTVVILSVGLLGAGQLAMISLDATRTAIRMDRASAIAFSLIEMIGSNNDAIGAYTGTVSDEPGERDCDAQSPCANQDLAVRDLALIRNMARQFLGETAEIAVECGTPRPSGMVDECLLHMSWQESGPRRESDTFAVSWGFAP